MTDSVRQVTTKHSVSQFFVIFQTKDFPNKLKKRDFTVALKKLSLLPFAQKEWVWDQGAGV